MGGGTLSTATGTHGLALLWGWSSEYSHRDTWVGLAMGGGTLRLIDFVRG